MKKILIILQNAWSPLYAGGIWPRESWLRALHRSRSGQRLKIMTDVAGPEFEFDYDNTTAAVSAKPSGVCPPDLIHVTGVFARVQPHIVVLCGGQAAALPSRFTITQPTLLIPHPAYRVVTNALFRAAGRHIRDGFTGCWRLEQRRGDLKLIHISDL